MLRLSNFTVAFIASNLTMSELDTISNLSQSNVDPLSSPLSIAVSTFSSLFSILLLEFFRAWLKRWKEKQIINDTKPQQDRSQQNVDLGN